MLIHSFTLSPDPLDLVERDLIAGAIVALRGARAFVGRSPRLRDLDGRATRGRRSLCRNIRGKFGNIRDY
jgi:hypothetical protein